MFNDDYQTSDYDDDNVSLSLPSSIIVLFFLSSPLVGVTLFLMYYYCIHVKKKKRVIAVSMEYRGVESNYSLESNVVPEVCTICYEDYKVGDKLFSFGCDHSFHHKCVKNLFTRNTINAKCPYCNLIVVVEIGEV